MCICSVWYAVYHLNGTCFTTNSQLALLHLHNFFLPVLRSFSVEEALATVGEKLCVELSQCLSQHGYSPFSADRKNTLKGQISATSQPDNTVHKLMGKSIDTCDDLVLGAQSNSCWLVEWLCTYLFGNDREFLSSCQNLGFRPTSWLPWSTVNIRPHLLSQEAWLQSAGSWRSSLFASVASSTSTSLSSPHFTKRFFKN